MIILTIYIFDRDHKITLFKCTPKFSIISEAINESTRNQKLKIYFACRRVQGGLLVDNHLPKYDSNV